MKLELVPIPVADVDRAKAFYVEKLGFVEDVDVRPADGVRVVQVTPPGSACSIGMGTGLPAYDDMTPGAIRGLHLVVADIEQARADLRGRGVDVGEVVDVGGGGQVRLAHRPRRQHPDPAGDGLADRRRVLIPAGHRMWLQVSGGARRRHARTLGTHRPR
jgi:catechol 2,3-dioxygenase-like lactoylglutathione lyase family enzyme